MENSLNGYLNFISNPECSNKRILVLTDSSNSRSIFDETIKAASGNLIATLSKSKRTVKTKNNTDIIVKTFNGDWSDFKGVAVDFVFYFCSEINEDDKAFFKSRIRPQ